MAVRGGRGSRARRAVERAWAGLALSDRLRLDALSENTLRVLRPVLVGAGLLAYIVAAAAIVTFEDVFAAGSSAGQPGIGDVVEEDIRAITGTVFESAVLTEQRRAAAAASISPVYDPPDPNVARQQTRLLRQILDYIEHVRADGYSTPAQKAADLRAITTLTLTDDLLAFIVALDAETWQAVDDEAMLVLERIMRESIRQTDLAIVIDTLPTQVSVRFDVQTSAVIVGLVRDLLRPNRLLNPTATETARAAAVAAIEPETRSFQRGQVVVRAGTRIDEADFEALNALGLLQTPDQQVQRFMRALLLASLVVVVNGLYISRRQRALLRTPRELVLGVVLSLIALLGARLLTPDELPYLFPMAALALVLVVLINPEVAIVASIGQGLLAALMLSETLEVAAYFAIGGIVGALTMRVTERINAYFFAGLSIALANCFVVGVFNLPERLLADGTGFTSLLGYAVLNGLGAAMTALAAIFLLTFAFNLTTSVKLAELSQPNQPLLQRLLREAPGTYQHSLQVANLCEQAASAIGADAELVRIAALYHDIGKMLNPAFFVENQVDGVNPHDVLADPYRSADIIINHVVDGDRLARQYRLPARIRDFILEHHGTTRVGYFYNQAVRELDDPDGVDEDQFRYPGPRPRSRETAILMLADASESTVRARKPGSRAEVAEIIGGLIEQRIAEKQLDHSGLTLRDLDAIHQILVELLQSVFHPRINYPAAVSRRTLGLDLGEAAETVRPADLPARPVPAKDGTAELPRAGTSTPAGDGPRDDGRGEQRGVNGFRSPIDDDETPVSQVPPLRRTSLVPAVTPPAEPETNVPPIA